MVSGARLFRRYLWLVQGLEGASSGPLFHLFQGHLSRVGVGMAAETLSRVSRP